MTDIHSALGPGAEFDAIRALIAQFGSAASGIGDDAASLELPRGDRLVVSVDAFIENRHFREAWITPREIGYRAATAALSDLAAMAATPVALLLAINLPDAWRDRLSAIGEGVAEAARACGAHVVGGNLAAAAELSITTTVIGSAYRPLARSGGRVGDRVYVTGRLGGPATAVAAWSRGEEPTPADRARFAAPVARIREARWLADHGASACIDISDGTVADARHIAAASAATVELDLSRFPAVPGVSLRDAAASGEEYELIVTAAEIDVLAFTSRFGLPLTEIGRITAGAGEVRLLDQGQRVAGIGGHDHLSS